MLRDSLVRRSGPADYFVLCVVLTLSAGCSGDSGPERVKVSGRVTIDGTDVALGTIAFVSRSGGRTAATMINDGEYSISQNDGPTPGPQKVVIQAHRKTGKVLTVTKSLPGPPGEEPAIPPGGLKIEETEPILPARFNSESELTVELQSGNNRNVDFELSLDTSSTTEEQQ